MAVPWASPPPDPSEEPERARPRSADRPADGPTDRPNDPVANEGAGDGATDSSRGDADEMPAMSLPWTSRALPPELDDLSSAIESLLATDPHDWDDTTVYDAMVGVVRLGSKLDAVASSIGAVWDGRRLWAEDGSRSARARLGRDTGESPTRLGGILWRATRLRSMPLVLAAWRNGEIGTDRVTILCRANTPARAERFAENESHLLWMATAFDDLDTFSRHIRLWSDLADEAGADPDPESRARKQKESRHLHVGNGLDGVRFLQGRLDAVDGEIFGCELQRIEQALFEADWAEIRAQHGDKANATHLTRTAPQRRADALTIMAERSAAFANDAKRARPLITVVVDQASLTGPIRELFNRTVLTPGQIAPLLAEADIERAVFDGPSRVLDLGARNRLFTGATRRAIEIRDRHCSFPGCRVDVDLCQVDHIVEWTDGGPTIQSNGRLLCPAHNRQRPGRRTSSAQTPTSGDEGAAPRLGESADGTANGPFDQAGSDVAGRSTDPPVAEKPEDASPVDGSPVEPVPTNLPSRANVPERDADEAMEPGEVPDFGQAVDAYSYLDRWDEPDDNADLLY